MSTVKIIGTTLTICILLSVPIASAKFHFRGGSVFDAKRFADSVKETAEMINNVQNSTLSLAYMEVKNTSLRLNDFTSRFIKIGQMEDATSSGYSLININRSHADMENNATLGVMDAISVKGERHKDRILQEASVRNMETLAISKDSLLRQQERHKLTVSLSALNTDANLAEAQKLNIQGINSALNSLEKTKMTASALVAELQSDQDKTAISRLDNERRKQQAFKAYDPYNPTKLDVTNIKKIKNESENLGFIPFNAK